MAEGQFKVLNSVASGNINEGDTVTSVGGDIQVHLLAGDIYSTWEMRWYALTPDGQWDNEYFTPVGTVNKSGEDALGCTRA